MAKQVRDIKQAPFDWSKFNYVEGRPILTFTEYTARTAERQKRDLQKEYPGFNIMEQLKWE